MITSGAGKRYAGTPDIEADGLPSDYARHGLYNFSTNAGVVGMTCNVGSQVATRSCVDGQMIGAAILIPFQCVVYGLQMIVSASPTAITTDNNQQVGLYSSDGTDLTRVAQSADLGSGFYQIGDGTGITNNQRVAPFSTPYTVTTPGVYWAVLLTNWSAITGNLTLGATPTLTSNIQNPLCTTNVKRYWTLAAQTVLPSGQPWVDVSATTSAPSFLAIGKSS